VTDENRKRRDDPGNPDICNVYTLHKYFSKKSEIDKINKECRTAEIGCVDCKKNTIRQYDKELHRSEKKALN
jgi:tryptophanyl-tRNA synthetase